MLMNKERRLTYLAVDQDYWARERYWQEFQWANWLYRTNIFRESANKERDQAVGIYIM